MALADTKTRNQQIPRRPSSHNHPRHHHHHHNEPPYQSSPLIQQHQPFPSSTSSFSIRNSTISSSTSLLGPNDHPGAASVRPGSLASTSHVSSNNNVNNANSHYNFIQPTNYERRVAKSYSFGEGSLPRGSVGRTNGSTRTGTGIFGNESINNSNSRPRAVTMHELLLQQRNSNSDLNSLYTIDQSNTMHQPTLYGDEDDDVSYFGSAGQDYLLKKRRARMARRICAVDAVALVGFTALVALVESGGGTWTWEWGLIPWPLASMAVVRVLTLAFTARYSHGNYNVGVIFVCGLITLYTLFEINMVIQHHIQVATVVVAQYVFTLLMTQMHWISYSAHTPMSATLAYAYDPIMSDSITFSRESRHMGTVSGNGGKNGRQSSLRRGTSYGTMGGSPFDAVQELDEGEDDDDNAFIKVNVDMAASRKKHFGQYRRVSGSQSSLSDGGEGSNKNNNNNNNNNKGENEEDEEEDQDMAVLLAFQDARRQQVYAFSPTASSSVLPARSILSPPPGAGGGVAGSSSTPSGQLNKTPLSWAFRPQDSYSSSYDMRIAAAGGGGGVGGLTVGYTPRKRATRRSNFDPNGTGRRTWTGGHSIIYSGILLESSDDEAGDGGLDDTGDQDGDAADGDVAVRDSFEEDEEDGGEFGIHDEDQRGDEEQTVEYTQATETAETTETSEMTETTITTRETKTASHETTVVQEGESMDSDHHPERNSRILIDQDCHVDTIGPHRPEGDGQILIDQQGHEDTTGPHHPEGNGQILIDQEDNGDTTGPHRPEGNDQTLIDQGGHRDKADPALKVEIDDTKVDHGHRDLAGQGVVHIVDEPSRTTPTVHAINTPQETTPSSEEGPQHHVVGPTGNKNLDSVLTFQDDQIDGHQGSNDLSNGRRHGVSTVKVKKSSNKQITAVLCEDPNCKEHSHQGGPPPDVDLGPDFPQDLDRANIVDLDIKESSTESVERIGPNASDDNDDSHHGVPSGRKTIRHPELGAIELNGSLDLDNIIGPGHPHDGEHGSREVHVRQRIEKTTIVESEEVPSGIGPDGALVVAVDPNALMKLVPAPLSPPNEPGDQDHIHMEGGRRVHIRQRTERITIEEEDELGRPAVVGGAIVGGAVVGGVIVADNQPGLIVGPNVSTISPERPALMPGGWVGIKEQPGVVTWGYATDVDQPTMIVEPTTYIPPEQPVIVGGPGPIIKTVDPVIVIEEPRPVAIPQRVVVPPPQPVIARPPPRITAPPPRMIQPVPQPMIQPAPQPMIQHRPAPIFQPPARPMIRPPPVRMMPQPQPQIMAPPVPVVQQPVPRAIVPEPAPIIPAPMPIVQPAPQYVAPVPPAMAMPQPMVLAPASEYAYYDEVTPMGVGGYGAYSVASIYDNENRSIASIYDDRSAASVYEYENQPGAGYGPAYGPAYGPGGAGYEPGYGPVYEPGYGRHLVSAARIGRTDSPGPLHRDRRDDGEYIDNRHMPRQKSPPQSGHIDDLDGILRQQSPSQRVLDQQRFYHESAAYTDNRLEPTRALSPRYLERERFERGADVYLDNHPAQGQMSPRRIDRPERQGYFQSEQYQRPKNPQGGAEETLEYIANRHVSHSAAIQNKEPEEELYQEMELGAGIGQVQELALETYYDTTKSQLKAREQQGNALAEKVFQLHRSSEPVTPSIVAETIGLEPAMRPQPPTFSIPKPPANPPPVRLLVNRSVCSSPKPTTSPVRALQNKSSFPKRYSPTGSNKRGSEEEDHETSILSTSSSQSETIMLQARHQPMLEPEPLAPVLIPSAKLVDTSPLAVKARSFVSGVNAETTQTESSARHPLVTGAKKRRKEHFPAMSRNHLHPSALNEGIWACWNNEFGAALEIFKEHAATYPRWCLAAAEVHIVRQLISGQLSEPDLDLTDALQLSEKVSSRVLDKKQEFDSNYMGYRSLCAADASLVTVNDNTLRQNYKWDCEMAFYDMLLYRGILQLTSASDTKGTFTDIKGGLQLRRAWKGYMRIKQEMELAKEKWQRLSVLNAASTSSSPSQGDDKENTPPQGAKAPLRSKTALAAVTVPISISTSKRASMQSSQQPSEGSRWSIFGRRASLSSSPPVEGSDPLTESGPSRSRFLAAQLGGPSRGLASALRDQAKAVEEFKHAVNVLEDTEDYLQYGIGLFYFIVSIVPKSLVPALRTIGLQSNPEQGIKNFEDVLSRKNGRAPFAALFLLINYLFLPRGVADPSISLGRAGVILNEALRRCPNGSSYLLMACHHARKTGNMIPSALNHITRGIQTCEAAGIPSINYRFELGLTFFIHQEFGKAADIFEILWRKYISVPDRQNQDNILRGYGGRRKGRSQSLGQPVQASALSVSGTVEEDEEDDFELAPFCGLCLIASKVVVRLGQEGYFEYGREGFGRNAAGGANSAGGTPSSMEGVSSSNFGRMGPDFDLLVAAQEVLSMMSPPTVETLSSPSPQPLTKASTLIFEHVKAGSSQSLKYVRDLAQGASTDSGSGRDTTNPLLAAAPVPAQGKLNRFNKFAWNQCQKSIQKGRISPFLPLVILYLRRDLAYMKPVLLRKYRTLLESIWKTVSQPVDADTQAIYLLLSAVVHRQLLPDDATFAYTALTDCLLLESIIESEMWVVPYCHYELGELLFKKLQLPHAAIEQFQWILKGPGKEVRPASVYVSTFSASTSNPRLSVFGGGFPSDTVTQLVESASQIQEVGNSGDGHHTQHLSSSSQYRLSQFLPGAGPTSQTAPPTAPNPPNPPNPMSFYNSRYKKFEFSQVLRHRSSICVEQIQKAIEEANETGGGGSASTSASSSRAGTLKGGNSGMVDVTSTSRRSSLLANDVASKKEPEQHAQDDQPMSDKITEAVDEPMDLDPSSKNDGNAFTADPDVEMTNAAPVAVNGNGAASSDKPEVSGLLRSQTMPPKQISPLEDRDASTTTSQHDELSRSSTAYQAHFQNLKGWSASTLPNILTDAQRRRGSQQWLPGNGKPK